MLEIVISSMIDLLIVRVKYLSANTSTPLSLAFSLLLLFYKFNITKLLQIGFCIKLK